MTRVLLTSGSGFIAAHVLDVLLSRGHSVVTTVRSPEKAKQIQQSHSDMGKDKLDFAIVEDMAQPNAFEKAVVSDPPFEAVIHTASPYHFNATDDQKIKELLDTALRGTTGILKAVKANAPTVKRVIITSSFAAIVDPKKRAGHVYTEQDWDPISEKEAYQNPLSAYRASKTFAERAAWDFVEQEKPNFSLTTCNPPLVLGPIVHHLTSLSSINTSNQRIVKLITGAGKEKCPPTGNFLWVDVRDVALAHVLAMEKDEAAGKRFLISAGNFSNRMIVDIIRNEYPELRHLLPEGEALKSGDFPEDGNYNRASNAQSKELLGVSYRSLQESVMDAVKSLQAVGA